MKFYFPFLLLILLFSCKTDHVSKELSNYISINTIHQDIIYLEYLLLSDSRESADQHAKTFIYHLTELNTKIDPSLSQSFSNLDKFVNQLIQDLNDKKSYVSLQQKMELIKEEMIKLSFENKDSFFLAHWIFDAKILPCIYISQDELLDLNEWNEFELIVDIMNKEWKIYERQVYDYEFLLYDHAKIDIYIQSISELSLAIDKFNSVVYNDQDDQERLCVAGERLNNKYIKYIESLVPFYTQELNNMQL